MPSAEASPLRVGVTPAAVEAVGSVLGRLGAVGPDRVGQLASLREALLGGELDVVAHSYLDPAASAGLEVVAVPRRPTADYLPPERWSAPSACGGLALEMAVGAEQALRRRVAKLDHGPTRLAAAAERAVVAAFERVPGPAAHVAAGAMLEDGLLFLTATRYADDGSAVRSASHACYAADSTDPAGDLAARVIAELCAE